jgi:hypothetical protein
MSGDEEIRQARTARLRKQIDKQIASPKVDESNSESDAGTPEMLPGESPHDYVERRMREIKKKHSERRE